MQISVPTLLCLIACHGGPADHFATYSEALKEKGYQVQIHATGPALKKFQDRGIQVDYPFEIDNLTNEEQNKLAQTIIKTCSTFSLIITDVGHPFDVKIQQALNVCVDRIPSLAYYDNPEPYVPGGYSSTAAEVMKAAQGVLFANSKLTYDTLYQAKGTKIDLDNKKKFGIGYYPLNQIANIASKRKTEHDQARSQFLLQNEIVDHGQKIFIYFGGNNSEYFEKAFPAFLDLVAKTSDSELLKNSVIVIQQHPGAKSKNLDAQQVDTWLETFGSQANKPLLMLSDFSSDQAQILADAAFYYQTSMGPQFVLQGIPTIQIGHETYEDILVKNKIAPTVTDVDGFLNVLKNLNSMENYSQDDLINKLGIYSNWPEKLDEAIQELIILK